MADDRVSFSLGRGEIRALLGENGAGKSTLASCVYGLCRMDAGELFVDGAAARIAGCHDAIRLGIGLVSQHFMLVPGLSVAENILLGGPGGFWADQAGTAADIRELSERYGFGIDPGAMVQDLPVGQRQRVEILKLLRRQARIMIFDEPSAVLSPAEAGRFLDILRGFKAEGRSVILITHRLPEVAAVCDSVTVLRDGRVVGEGPVAALPEAELARLMVGRPAAQRQRQRDRAGPAGPAALALRGLRVKGSHGHAAVVDVNLTLRCGEILGIAGVDGNGQQELADAICGLRRAAAGQVVMLGATVTDWRPARRRALGLAYIPPDRQRSGLIMDYSAQDNLASAALSQRPLSRWGLLSRPAIRRQAERLIAAYDIKGCRPETTAGRLSGGNQQRLLVARELDGSPRVVVANQPTRGLDFAAVEAVRSRLACQRDAGAAILLISSELDEILALADRVAVLFAGRLSAALPAQNCSLALLGLLMAGQVPPEQAAPGPAGVS